MRTLAMAAALVALTGAACTNHLFFVESAHLGLKAKFSTDGPAPAEISIGYRRGLVAIVPQRKGEEAGATPRVQAPAAAPGGPGPAPGAPTQAIVIYDDREDLMGLYTVFRANVGINDPTDICHFLATGRAAAFLLSNKAAIEGVTHNLCARREDQP